MRLIHRRRWLVLLFYSLLLVARAQQVAITPSKEDGVYEVGELVTWTISAKEPLDSARFVLKKGGLTEVEHGPLTMKDGVATKAFTFDTPGTVLLEVRWGKENSFRAKAVGGAVAMPEKLVLSAARPGDFDRFWKSKIKELKKVPANAKLEKVDGGKSGVDYWKVTMDNIRGSHIQGQLAHPSVGNKFPAMLIVQWAGVYGLSKDWAVNRAAAGWLVLNISAHDLPIDQTTDYYKEAAQGALKNYAAIGNDDKDSSYFLRMYLSCYRAAQYLTERDDWNGETLVVMGDSQGGQQSLMTAGLHPRITAAMALVPAGFDMLGPDVGRKGGWPHWYNDVEGHDAAKVREASRYFDVANFIPRIKCPILVGVGLLDETCPPEGILAAINLVSTPKQVIILPKSGHQDFQGSQAPFREMRDNVWLPALLVGKQLPNRQPQVTNPKTQISSHKQIPRSND